MELQFLDKLHNSEDAPKIMPLQLLSEITNNFSEERKLGCGTYGEVFKGVHNGEDVAVKKLRQMPGLFDDVDQFKKEFENLKRLRHENIVQLLGYSYETRHEYVVLSDGTGAFAQNIYRALCFEYMHNGSLRQHLYDEYHGLDWQTRYKIIKGICKGLKYLHEELESPIYHLDVKPENILLDNTMVPKLADFGLSKLVHNGQTQATLSFIGTRGYMPPEYIDENLVSKKFDIFSLGVVMIRTMTGYEGYQKKAEMSSQEFIDLVHNNWRNRLQATPGCTSLEDECHQVKRCTEIALDCVKADRKQRPEIGAIIHWLNETEHLNEKLAINLPYEMRHDTMSHVDKACSSVSEVQSTIVSDTPSPLQKIITVPIGPAETTYEISSLGSTDISKLLSVHPLELLFNFEPNKLIQCPVSLTNRTDYHVGVWITPTSSSTCSSGVFECSSPFGIVEPQCIWSVTMIMNKQQKQPSAMTDRFEVLMIVVGPGHELQLLKSPIGSTMNANNKFLKRIEELGGKIHRVVLMPVICDPAPEAASRQLMSASAAPSSLQRIIGVLKGPGETNSEIRFLGPSKASKLLDVYPLELHFSFEPNKVIECPVTLINMTDHHIGVWITPTDQYTLSNLHFPELWKHKPSEDPCSSLFQMIVPHSSWSIAMSLEQQEPPPQVTGEFEVVMIITRTEEDLRMLVSSAGSKLNMDRNFWKRVDEMSGAEVHRAMLSAVICDPASRQPVIHNQNLIPAPLEFGEVSCIDVHPTKTWILVGQRGGCISVLNYEMLIQHTEIVLQMQLTKTKAILPYFKHTALRALSAVLPVAVAAAKNSLLLSAAVAATASTLEHTNSSSVGCNISSAKFIAGEEWFTTGDDDGWVHVYSYITKDKVKEFDAHHGKLVSSLAVHPTLPFLLTASSCDNWIKLWDWRKDWKCLQKFDNERFLSCITWNPWDTNTFAGASFWGVKVWGLHSPDPITTLTGLHQGPCCFYSDSHQNFMVTSSCFHGYHAYMHNTAILDMQSNKNVHQFAVATNHQITDVACHPTLPIIVTVSDSSVCLSNASTYRLVKMVNFTDHLVRRGMVLITGTKNITRLIIGFEEGISVMEIKLPTIKTAVQTGGGDRK